METIFTERHNLRNSRTELFGGQLVEPFERPSRAEYIIDRVREVALGPVIEPDDFGMAPITAIHDADFLPREDQVRVGNVGVIGPDIRPIVWIVDKPL